MWTREVSSPTDRTFQICFAVAASTLAGYKTGTDFENAVVGLDVEQIGN
jgi:hypothetical protein